MDQANSAKQAPYRPPNPFGIKPAYWERILEMRLLDDLFMRAALDDNPEAVQLILRIILEKPDLIVKSVHTQREYKNLYGHSVRLDVEATDSEGKLYNIEIQRSDEGAAPERARFNSALLDTHALQSGQDAANLPETYVVFITENDLWKRDIAVYHIDRVIAETGEKFGDRAHIVYANGAYRGETAIGRLMADFRAKDPETMYYSALAERVRHLKYSETGVSHMCRAMESLVQEERELAIRIGRAEDLRSIMDNTNWPLDRAMAILNIPMEERQKYRELLERQS